MNLFYFILMISLTQSCENLNILPLQFEVGLDMCFINNFVLIYAWIPTDDEHVECFGGSEGNF